MELSKDTVRLATFIQVIIILCLDITSGRDVRLAQSHPVASCIYGNETYQGGTRFRPDPCTYCHCPHHGGRPHCSIEDCKYEEDCVRFVKTHDSTCCDICAERGCRGNDGRTYKPGEVISQSVCETCLCSADGGGRDCIQMACPDVTCVDAVKDKNQCCHVCPNGPNCWLGKKRIPVGKVVLTSRCKTCQCPSLSDPAWVLRRAPKAICSITKC